MTALLALTIERTDLALPAADIEAAAAFARNEKAPATRAAYRSDFAMFREWCQGKGVNALPASPGKAWLHAAGITEGPLFRPVAKGGRPGAQRLTDKSVCDLVKTYAERLGLKAADFGAHSLRAGFLTSAARRGASVFKMREVSRHKSMDVLQAYVRDADLFRDHAGAGLL